MSRKPLDFKDLGKIVMVSSPSIAPDGSKALFVVSRVDLEKDRYERNIWFIDLEEGFYEALTPGDNDSCPKWSPEGWRYAFLSKRGVKEEEKGVEVWIGEFKVRSEPRKLAYFKGGVIDYYWSPRGDSLLVITRVGEPDEDVMVIEKIPIWFNGEGYTYNTSKQLLILDVNSGNSKPVSKLGENVVCAAWSRDGSRIAYAASVEELKPYETRLYIYDVRSDETVEVPIGNYSITALAWSPRDEYIALLARRLNTSRGLAAHYKVWITKPSGESVKCLVEGLDRNTLPTVGCDVRGPSCSPKLVWCDNGDMYFLVSNSGIVSLYKARVGEGYEEYLKVENHSIDEFDVSKDADTIVFTAMSSTKPKELYAFKSGEVRELTSFNSFFLKEAIIGKPEKFKFKASDGVEIDCWLLRPQNSSREKVPWILYIHGGPKMMFGEGFMFEFHMLASRGFGVLYLNPRGSDGYSEEFADIRGKYGERDYQDLIEAVDYALKRYKFLDPNNIGVAGGSYAGFMVNWIITHTQKFKAAVTQRSICNWISKYGTTDIGFYFNSDMIGKGKPPWENVEDYWEKSPLKHVKNVKTPLLIIHSIEDYRCWLDQALQMFTALKVLGVKTRLVLFPKENHDLSRSGKPKHRVERLKHIVEWFENHLVKASASP